MRRMYYSTERNQIKAEKSKIGISNHGNDVIHVAHKVICNINVEKIGDFSKFGNIGTFGDIATGSILAKNREIAYVFGDIGPALSGLPVFIFFESKKTMKNLNFYSFEIEKNIRKDFELIAKEKRKKNL